MRVTVCELPHEPAALGAAWDGLCGHTLRHAPELVLLPEFAFVPPLWERDAFDCARWDAAVSLSDAWMPRLRELRAVYVVGARPANVDGRPYNQGFLWSAAGGVVPLRRKYFLPDEPGSWETRWFDNGDPCFPAFRAGALSFGLNICTEMWALDTYADYAVTDVQAILSPRATAADTTAKWMSAGVVGAVRSGAFSLSSNRVDQAGAYGGTGWIISPDGRLLASTTRDAPFATLDIDLAASVAARASYPRNVLSGAGACIHTVTARPTSASAALHVAASASVPVR